jgi:hypothetical protein
LKRVLKPRGGRAEPEVRKGIPGEKTTTRLQARQIHHDPISIRLYIDVFPINRNL